MKPVIFCMNIWNMALHLKLDDNVHLYRRVMNVWFIQAMYISNDTFSSKIPSQACSTHKKEEVILDHGRYLLTV